MATMTQMPQQPPPALGGLRSGPNEESAFSGGDDESWLRELTSELKRNMHERLREQEKEIEDEMRLTLAQSSHLTAGQLSELRKKLESAKEERLKTTRKLLIEEGEATIRFERGVRRLGVEDDSEVSEVLRKEQQAILDMFSKEGRRSTSSSPTTDRQMVRDNPPKLIPPVASNSASSTANSRPSAPRISPTASASSTHAQSSQLPQQQQRKLSQQQYIWTPPASSQVDAGHSRAQSAVNGIGSSAPQRANSISDNGARRRTGSSYSYQPTPVPSASYVTPPSQPFVTSQKSIPPKAQTSLVDDFAYFSPSLFDEPEEYSSEEEPDDDDAPYSDDDYEISDEDPTLKPSWLRGSLPTKSSPRSIQADRGRGRGRAPARSTTIPSQHTSGSKHSIGDLRGTYEYSHSRNIRSASINDRNRAMDYSTSKDIHREEPKAQQQRTWKPPPETVGADYKPTQPWAVPTTNKSRNNDQSTFAEGMSYGSYGSLGSGGSFSTKAPNRRPSNINLGPQPMTPEERERHELRESERKWDGMEKARVLQSQTQTNSSPTNPPPISSASRSTIPIIQNSVGRQKTPDPTPTSANSGSGSYRGERIWRPTTSTKETPAPVKPAPERERQDTVSSSRSPSVSQQTYYRSRNDSEISVPRFSERNESRPRSPVRTSNPPATSNTPQPAPQISSTTKSSLPGNPQFPPGFVNLPFPPQISPQVSEGGSSDSSSNFSSTSQRPSAAPLSRYPTEELLWQPSDRDRFKPRNHGDDKRSDEPFEISASPQDQIMVQLDPSPLQKQLEMDNRKAEEEMRLQEERIRLLEEEVKRKEMKLKQVELKQKEEDMQRRLQELAELEEAIAKKEEIERARREAEQKLKEEEKRMEEDRLREEKRKEEEKARQRMKEEEERLKRVKEEERVKKENEARALKEREVKRAEAERIKKEDAERAKKEKEAERIWREKEAERIRKEEADRVRKEKEEAERVKREEADRVRKEKAEAERIKREEAERVWKEHERARKLEEERARQEAREEEECRERERNAKKEQEERDRVHAEYLQREEEILARNQERKEAKARQGFFPADRPTSTASFASTASGASFASRASTTSSSSGSSYSSWSTGGRSTASSATSASSYPEPSRKSSTSSASAAWGAPTGQRSSSASASAFASAGAGGPSSKPSSTSRHPPSSSFPPKGTGTYSASASAAGSSGSYVPPLDHEEWERRQQEKAKAQQEQFQREQMRVEQERLRANSASSGKDTIMVAWSSYEREWNGLKDKPDGSLKWMTFPWPTMRKPSEPEDITANGIGALILSTLHSSDKSTRDRLKEQLLRWHPDRFENRWLKKVSEKDQEKVRNGAGQVVRALNELMTRENNLSSGGGLF